MEQVRTSNPATFQPNSGSCKQDKSNRFMQISSETASQQESRPDRVAELVTELIGELRKQQEIRDKHLAIKVANEFFDILESHPERMMAVLERPIRAIVEQALNLSMAPQDAVAPPTAKPVPEILEVAAVPEITVEQEVAIPVPAPPIPEPETPVPEPVVVAPEAVEPPKKKKRVSASPKGSEEYKRRKTFQQQNYYRRKKGLPPLPQPSSWSVPLGRQDAPVAEEAAAVPADLEDG